MPVMSAFLTMRGFSAPTVTLSRHFEEQGPRANGARKIGYPKPYQGRVQISVFPRSRQFHQFPVRRFVTVLRLEIGGQFKKSLSDRHLFPGKRLVSERSGCAHPFRIGSDPAERVQN